MREFSDRDMTPCKSAEVWILWVHTHKHKCTLTAQMKSHQNRGRSRSGVEPPLCTDYGSLKCCLLSNRTTVSPAPTEETRSSRDRTRKLTSFLEVWVLSLYVKFPLLVAHEPKLRKMISFLSLREPKSLFRGNFETVAMSTANIIKAAWGAALT